MTNLPQEPRDHHEEEEPQSLSLLSGVANVGAATDAELLEAEQAGSGGRKIGQGGLAIVAVAVLGAGALFAMRMTQGELHVGTPKEVEAKIEDTLTKLAKPASLAPDDPLRRQNLEAMFQDTESIVAMFAADLSEHQVPVEYVKKNPFQLAIERPEGVVAPASDIEKARAKRLEELNRELAGYELQTVMVSGSREVAVIDGELVQPRQKLGSFLVQAIDPMGVTLTVDGETFRLAIQSENEKKGRR